MKSIQLMRIFTLATLSFAVFAHASKPDLVIEKGDARAERVLSYHRVISARPAAAIKPDERATLYETVGGIYPQGSSRPNPEFERVGIERIWKALGLGKLPDFDLKTHVVTVNTSGGSGIHMSRQIDKRGHFWVMGGGGTKDIVHTPDGARGTTYLVEVYKLSGITGVNGFKWPPTPVKKEDTKEEGDSAEERAG